MVIGIGGPSSGVHQIDVQDPTQNLHCEVFHRVQATPWLLDIDNFEGTPLNFSMIFSYF